jgi:hypothetical protein
MACQLQKMFCVNIIESLYHRPSKLLRDPAALDRSIFYPGDATIALLRIVVARVDDYYVVGTPANKSRGRLGMFFCGIVTTTTSPLRAASSTVTGVAPVSAARSARVSGPREFATKTL